MKIDLGELVLLKLKKRGIIISAVLAVSVIAGAAYWYNQGKTEPNSAVTYEQTKVRRDNITIGFDSDGVVNYSKVNLRFGVKGSIKEILVKEGSAVQQNTVIARLNDTDYQDQHQLALAKYEEAKKQEKDSKEQQMISLLDDELRIKKSESDLLKLKNDYLEMEKIPDAFSPNEITMKKNELAQKEIEHANMLKKFEIAQAKYLNNDKQLDQNELSVKMAKENLENTILYSPISGTVLKLAKKVGESVTDEQDFAVIHENNEYIAVTKVIEYDVSRIKVGQKVAIRVEALPDSAFAGEVRSVDMLPTSDSSGLVSYEVKILLTNPNRDIRDGMTSRISFIQKQVSNCLIVPYRAVKIVDRKQYVTLLDANGQMVDKEIKAGFTDGTNVEVLEGLAVGDTVVYLKK